MVSETLKSNSDKNSISKNTEKEYQELGKMELPESISELPEPLKEIYGSLEENQKEKFQIGIIEYTQIISHEETFFPPPQYLASYEQLYPGASKTIFEAYKGLVDEEIEDHKEKRQLKKELLTDRQKFSKILSLLLVILIVLFAFTGHENLSIAIVAAFAAIIGAFALKDIFSARKNK